MWFVFLLTQFRLYFDIAFCKSILQKWWFVLRFHFDNIFQRWSSFLARWLSDHLGWILIWWSYKPEYFRVGTMVTTNFQRYGYMITQFFSIEIWIASVLYFTLLLEHQNGQPYIYLLLKWLLDFFLNYLINKFFTEKEELTHYMLQK